MDLKNQGNGPETSPNILPKRKRGRPRKDRSQTPSGINKVDHIRDQGGFVQSPPKFTMTDGNHSQQASPQQNDAAMVGQPVNGVVDSTYEAGYFISIKIGNSDTILRGFVLKPGHCFPASISKDLEPQIEMVDRNAVPFSAGLHTPVQSSSCKGKGRAKPKKETHGSCGSDLVKLLGDRGRLVPVVLKPANLSSEAAPNIGSLPALSKPAHLAASKSASINQTLLKQMEKKDNDPPLPEMASKIQVSVAKLPVNVVEELVTDVAKMVNISSRSNEMQSKNGQPCGAFSDEQMGNWTKPFLVKPLHGMHSGPFNQFPLVPMNFGYGRPGKMTELLLAVQGNVICKQAEDAQSRGFSWN